MKRQDGWSLVELLVATGIGLSLLACGLAVLGRMQVSFTDEAERADMQQRLRVASDELSRRLIMAGAGASQGTFLGPLNGYLPGVVPFRQGASGADTAGSFKTDVLSILFVPAATAAQTTLRQPAPAQSGSISINQDPGCSPGDQACGFSAGSSVLIFDETGAYDTFRVTSAQPGVLQLQHTMTDTGFVYAAGSKIVEASSHTYYLKTNAGTDTYQLMHYDGAASDAAVADHVVGLGFEYFGEPFPPALVRPVTDPIGPWTTYGPRPPPPGTKTSQYPAGENCVFQLDATGLQHVQRLPVLGDGSSTTLVPLTAPEITDGPWCPDATSPRRWDADLLRVRKIVVRIRVEAQYAALRGPAGPLFSRAGTSRDANRWLPDQEVRLEISPRNLNAGR